MMKVAWVKIDLILAVSRVWPARFWGVRPWTLLAPGWMGTVGSLRPVYESIIIIY